MEDNVLKIIEQWGFVAEKIEEDNFKKTPDFLVYDGESLHLIELKTREDTPDTDKKQEVLELGEIFHETTPIVRSNTISGIVKKASKQLEKNEDIEVDFRLVWFAAVGMHQETKMELILASLFGTVGLVDYDEVEAYRRQCYYFGESDFFKYRRILDGAIISWEDKSKFCVNTYSPNYELFKKSKLYSFFGEAACDPIELERRNVAYYADTELPRTDPKAIMEYVKSKYEAPNLNQLNVGYDVITVAIE